MVTLLRRGVLAIAVLLSITSGLVATPANADSGVQAAKPAAIDSFYMINQRSSRCVEVPGYSTRVGTHVDQFTCVYDYHLNEMWYFKYIRRTGGHSVYQIINTYSGMCMNVSGASTANGAAVLQWPCSTSATNNLWYIDEVSGYHVWRNQRSNKCLNVSGASNSNGAWLVQYTCGNYSNEHFRYKSLCPTKYDTCARWPWYGW
jgi:hypothetical protein